MSSPRVPNRAGSTQAVLLHAARTGRDGHYVVFDEAPVKHRYGCFFETAMSLGGARVVAPATSAP